MQHVSRKQLSLKHHVGPIDRNLYLPDIWRKTYAANNLYSLHTSTTSLTSDPPAHYSRSYEGTFMYIRHSVR